VTKRARAPEAEHAETRMDLNHLRREARTALELAVVGLAPWELMERLAMVAGLLEALSELPADSPPALTLVPKVVAASKSCLADSERWQKQHLERRLARG
jgi:hypothetical protein